MTAHNATLSLPSSGVLLLAGPNRAGKTVSVLQIALSVASAHELFGAPIQNPGPVVFISGDTSPDQIVRWAPAMRDALNIGTSAHDLHFGFGPADWEAIERLCLEVRPKLVVIDALIEGASTYVVARLRALSTSLGALVLVTSSVSQTDIEQSAPAAPTLASIADVTWLTDRHLGNRIRFITSEPGGETATFWLLRDPKSFVAEPLPDGPVTASRASLANLIADHSQAAGLVKPKFAPHFVRRLERHLRDFANSDKDELYLSPARRRAVLSLTDRMGLTPIDDAYSLALIASALELDTHKQLVRLCWVANRDHSQTYDAAERRWQPMARDAMAMMGGVAEAGQDADQAA